MLSLIDFNLVMVRVDSEQNFNTNKL